MRYLIMAVVLALFILTLSHNLKASERAECLKWQMQASEFASWYSTDWQKEQCKQFGISFTK